MRLSSIKNIITVQIIFIIFILLTGCSSNSSNPVTGDITHQDNLQIAPTESNEISSLGIMGAYTLTLSPDGSNAELVSIRSSDLGESYIVSGSAFFTQSPCTDCLNLRSISLDDGFIKLTFKVSHPFEKGDPLKPPSAMNRLDLNVFDMALVIVPTGSIADTYTLTGTDIYTEICGKAAGYTRELAQVIGDDAALPYFLVVDDNETSIKTSNKFEMGTKDMEFNTWFKGGQFNLFLTMGYGASAKKPERLTPTYYIPEFNRKAAWKVIVTPPDPSDTWVEGDTTTEHEVTIDIYDWNHGVSIASVYPDPANTDQIYASSDISSVSVEIPGMTEAIVNATTTDTVTDGYSDPITYTASFANENSLAEGTYTGLVKVTDTRPPGVSSAGGETDTLVYSPNGIILDWFNIPEYATYQTFEAIILNERSGWVRTWGGTESDYGYDVAQDSVGNVYVSGAFRNTVDFNPERTPAEENSNGSHDIYVCKYDSTGDFLWVRVWGGSMLDCSLGVTTDNSGNVYTTGYYRGTVDFDTGPYPYEEDLHTSNGDYDAFLSKHDASGNFLWACTWGGSRTDAGRIGLETDSSNNIYVSGHFEGNVNFDPEGVGVWKTSNGDIDAFLSVFDDNENHLLVYTWGDIGGDNARNLALDSSENVYITGYFENTVDLDLTDPGIDLHSSTGVRDIYLIKLNSSMNFVSAVSFGGGLDDLGSAIAFDSLSNVYLTGYYQSSVDLDPGIDEDLHLPHGGFDAFLSKFDQNLSFIWAKTWGGTGNDFGRSVYVTNSDKLFIAGDFYDVVDFDPSLTNYEITSNGENDIFLSTFDSDGNFIDTESWGGPGSDCPYAIEVDTTDNLCLAGHFNQTVNFQITDDHFRTSNGEEDAFLMKIEL